MLVRNFMTSDVVTLSPDQTCHEALQELRRCKVRRAPVVMNNKLVGIVSERDLLRVLPGTCAQASTMAGEAGMDLPLRDIMRTTVITLSPSDHLKQAASLMLRHRIGGVPVVQGGQLKGIITESDIFKAFYGILTSPRGWVILFEEPARPAGAQHDYVKLCLEYGCRIHTVLKYPTPAGTTMYYLCVEGADIDAFVEKLRAMSNQVVLVE
jgi:acetoin utilization protein AcuB